MSEVLAFFADNPEAIWWASGVSTATFILGLVLLPVIALSLSPDYFITLRVPKASFRARHPIIRLLVRSLKNALGFVLLVAGVAMLFLPGQGLLTILAGLTLMEFPV